MRFIKRLIFIIVLLLVAFFVYRLINPTAAKALLYDLATFSNTRLHTHFTLNNIPLVATGTVLNETGIVEQQTGGLQEITGDDELLLNDITTTQNTIDTGNIQTGTISSTPCPAMPTVNSCPTNEEKYIIYTSSACGTYYACRTKTTTSNGLSSKDKRDANALLGNFK